MAKKNILDLKQKPNLSFGVNVSKISKPSQRKNYDIKPRIPVKKKIESIRDYNGDRVNFTKDIYNIWKNRSNTDTFDRKPVRKKGSMLSLILFLIIFGGFFVYVVFWNMNKDVKGEGVFLEIKGEDAFVSGKEAKFTIKYQNKQNVKIKNIELRINYPKDFHYVSSQPSATTLSMNTWKLGDLKANGSGEVELIGQVIGNVDDKVSLDGVLSYEQTNFSSTLEAKTTKEITIKESMMNFSFDGPDEIGNNNRVTYKMIYKNISDSDINNFRIRLEYPDNFIPIETSGDAKLVSENVWAIDDLKKDSEQNLSITGIFDLETVSSSTIKAFLEIKSLTDTTLNNGENPNWYTYSEIDKEIKLSKSSANLRLSINDKLTDEAVNWGSELSYQINYKNTSDAALENVSIKAQLDSSYFDLNSFQDNYNGIFDEKSKTITWNKDSLPSLAKLQKDQEGRISFKIKLLGFKDEFAGKDNLAATSSIVLSYGKTDEEKSKNQIPSNLIINRINTPVDFSVFSRYYDESGKAVGSGPIPPLVGEATSYQIVWKIKSKTSNLNEVSVKTTLPDNVDWGQGIVAEGQNITFNTDTRQVVWTIDNLQKNKENIAKFDVIATPEKNQIGKPMILNNAILFSAIDEYSKGKMNLSKNPLTTECIGDKKASGKGSVKD